MFPTIAVCFFVCVQLTTTSIVSQKLDVNYDKRLPPWRGQPIDVNISIPYIILVRLTENEMHAQWMFTAGLLWNDYRLSFDSEFHGVDRFFVPSNEIWKPNFFVFNSIETRMAFGDEEHNDAMIFADGTVDLRITQYVKCICEVDVARFPFDVQFCSIAYSLPVIPISVVNLTPTVSGYNILIKGNSEFEFVNFTTDLEYFDVAGDTFVKVFFIAHLRRFPTYYIVMVVVPTFIIALQTVSGALLPMDMENMPDITGLGLGSLLALLFMLSIVVDKLPKTPGLAWLGYYVIEELAICVFAFILGYFAGILRTFLSFDREPPSMLTTVTLVRDHVGLWKDSNSDRAPSIKSLGRARKAVWNKIIWRLYFIAFILFQCLNVVVLLFFLSHTWLPKREFDKIGL